MVTSKGGCRPGVCGDEAACHNLNPGYKCVCPHDNSKPTHDLRCPNRLLVPLTPSPIRNIIPPTEKENLDKEATNLNLTHHMPPNSSILAQQNIVVAATVTSTALLLLLVSTIYCWRRSKTIRCHHKHRKHQQNDVPVSVSKGLLAVERYAPNPQYSMCSLSELSTVPLLARDHITFCHEIGEGCFGKVYKGVWNHEEDIKTIAIKVLKESATKEAEEDFMREVEIMSTFKHANILSLIGIAQRETNKTPWMIFEFMTYGDLTEVLRSNSRTFWTPSTAFPCLTKESMTKIALQIANGMAYLATQRFVHRDLACRNCLVGEGLCVKIADFGMSRDVYTCDYYKIGGSRPLPVRWMSPESVIYGRFTLESDVWSYGVVLWEIFSLGKQPYYGYCNEEVVRLIMQGTMLFPPEDCLPSICELMSLCWKSEPRDRITFAEICSILQKAPSSLPATFPRPPAFPVTPQITTDVLDPENYLKPLQTEPKEYLQTLPD